MQLIDGKPVFSATDLVGYLACEHLTALEAAALHGDLERPHRNDRELEIIRKRGFEHEARYLASLRDGQSRVEVIDRDDDADHEDRIRRQADDTIAAMASGADVIFQAAFFDGRWLGYADFLLRVESPDRPSVWGPYHYEVADTKLARHVKAGAVLQVCSYVEQLERIQGVRPERMRIVLGGSTRETAMLRVDDFMAYYRAAKTRFEAAVLEGEGELRLTSPSVTYPEPVEHCDVCRWAAVCAQRRRDDDHLSLVAGISSRQRTALVTREIDTVVRLANAPIPFDPPLDGSSAASVERVREQARIQVAGRALPSPIYELLVPAPGSPIEPERGLAMLPSPDPGDLFLDLEGDPYAFDDGVDYLFGLLDTEGTFTPIWSYDPERPDEVTLAGEKAAFERLVDMLIERLDRFPNMHVYHYASYEPTALKRLMGRHATREDEVDRLLRGGVLVDLFRAVRQSLRASVESYSIKRIEPLYGFEREVELRDAGSSIVAFEEWLELGEGERPTSDILEEIARYNRDDVVSTARLRDWLESLRPELESLTGQEVPRPTPVSGDAPVQTAEADEAVTRVADDLMRDVPADPTQRSTDQQARWLLAQLLSWHRREKKATFWEFFHRMDLDSTELTMDKGALGPLEVVGPVGDPFLPTPRSRPRWRWRYRFPLQDFDLGSDLYDPARRQAHPDAEWRTWKLAADVVAVDEADGTIDLQWMGADEPTHPAGLVPLDLFNDPEHRAALLRLGEWVAANGIDAEGPWRAARDLLLRRAPRAGQEPGSALCAIGESELNAARRLGVSLHHGALAIQGPPGSGKTYTGARMIVSLVAAGKRVGITANSHKVIGNFIGAIHKAAVEEGVTVRIAQRVSKPEQGCDVEGVEVTLKNEVVRDGLREGTLDIVGGTSWLWASDKSEGLIDVLFVDEAGQVALANVLAMAGATDSIVLLGDPQQLDQPLQGSHPPGADRSALAHMLNGAATIPPDLGLFLEHTYRLHPDVAAFTSAAFYDGKLVSQPGLERQRIHGPQPMRGSGLRYMEADHVGADSVSRSEALQVAGIVRALVESGSTWTDQEGRQHPVTYRDVLVVAPYNAQVGQIASLLPAGARVGTVDKFQGQEAPISIYSMTSSSPEDAPRGMSFLYSRNRLNVATSRAKAVAIVVAEPALLRVRARTPEQMRLANALCQFVELATGQPAG
ncbi:MAG TPA: TM0106 family RecB-like putative nuclease [Candidatus Limnocylindria bacterium]|nr:TM0106 family RecB-like putative nuclease [Candidatus Limnocylindria bacterium]